jgi:hypothetical protein
MKTFRHVNIDQSIEGVTTSFEKINERYKPGSFIYVVGLKKEGVVLSTEVFSQIMADIRFLLDRSAPLECCREDVLWTAEQLTIRSTGDVGIGTLTPPQGRRPEQREPINLGRRTTASDVEYTEAHI